jgi:hypothetical protein
MVLYGAALRCKALPTEWLTKWLTIKGAGSMVDSKHVRISPLKRIHALRTVPGEGGSVSVCYRRCA